MTKPQILGHHSAVDIVDGAELAVVLLCEHASGCVPRPWTLPKEDSWLVGTHWSIDIGAEDLCRELCQQVGCSAVLAQFTRLLIDANRELNSPTLIRGEAEGRPIHMNQTVSPEDRRARIEGYWKPYHQSADRMVGCKPGGIVIGVHSFTPIWEGNTREMEVGVLFDRDPEFGHWAADWLERQGLVVAINEPYSGFNGLMYSPQRHATRHRRRTIELEIRQDLVGDPEWRRQWLGVFASFLKEAAIWAKGASPS